jgi:hypothetical protein
MTDPAVDIKPYLVSYVTIYFVGVVLAHVLTQLFSLGSIAGLSASVMFVSAYLTAAKFIDHQQRLPQPREKWRLIGGSLLLTWAASTLALSAIALVFGGREGLTALANLVDAKGIASAVVVFVIVSGLYLVVLYGVYHWSAKMIMQRRQPKAEENR